MQYALVRVLVLMARRPSSLPVMTEMWMGWVVGIDTSDGWGKGWGTTVPRKKGVSPR